MEKTYNPEAIEKSWYAFWETQGYFQPSGQGQPFAIMIPPPNVTGSLHMGHGFQLSLMDTLIRYQRMCGANTLWQVGTDHAGISTQMVVERELHRLGQNRLELGRENFVKKVWEWKQTSGNMITQQLRRLGASVDWSRERFTLDPTLSKAVQEVFIRLYDEGLIYRGKRLVNWDPHFLTAISDLEVIQEEEPGFLWVIAYPLVDSEQKICIATTRPETLLGDVAVAVHPEDSRYIDFIGKKIKLPLTDRYIPIIADPMVDKEFGTGAVKITPAHDFNDYAMGERHGLPCINIFTPEAKLNEQVPVAYRGLDRFVARERVLNDLSALGLMLEKKNHTLKVPRNDRGHTIIEPYLTDQWFVRMESLAAKGIEVVEQGKVRFVPDTWTKTYNQWMHNIQDWCISRQLWWGHRIPAWYDTEGKVYVGESEAAVRKKYELAATTILKQDDDVLDTWFSSALWPFATLGWPEQTADFKTFYPTQVLITGFDIIFFWVARMIMMATKFTQDVPFHEVYITGLIRDSEGQKMSKTKGNVLDPIDLIDGIELEKLVSKRTQSLTAQKAALVEKNTRKEFPQGIAAHGTDALRFTFCALATTGRDIRFDIGRLEGYRNFCNKLWNAGRYILMNMTDYVPENMGSAELSLPDKWILSCLQQVITQVREDLHQYRFDLATQRLYDFTWHEFCDWYLELSKPLLNSAEFAAAQKNSTQKTLLTVYEIILRLLHPFIPFITEEIWQQLKPYTQKTGASIMRESYPQAKAQYLNKAVEGEIEWLKNIILGVRNIRGEMNIAPKIQVPLILTKGTAYDRQVLNKNKILLTTLAKLDSITWLESGAVLPSTAMTLSGDLELHIPTQGLIDLAAEQKRLQKEIEKRTQDLVRSEQRLAQPNYVAKAPPEVVAKERERVAELRSGLEKLQQKYLLVKNMEIS